MARILVVTSPERGHLHPMIGVAQWLRRAGHEVCWLTQPERAHAVLGFEQVAWSPPHTPEAITDGEALARLVEEPSTLRAWIRKLLVEDVPALVAPLREAIRRVRPDCAALDPMQYAAVIACTLEGVPWAGVSSSLNPVAPPVPCALYDTVDALAPERAALFRSFGVEVPRFSVCDALSPYVTTVFATERYAGAASTPRVALVGPSVPPEPREVEPPFPWERLDGRPLVLASFGSQVAWQPVRLGVVAEACAALGAQAVLVAGALADTDFASRLTGAPVVVRYAPQRALLERAAVFVTHGGANSVMEALRAGVPMLVSAVCNDQPMQAARIEACGVGCALDLARATTRDVTRVLTQLLAPDAPLRASAAELAADYRNADGARRAAELVAPLAAPGTRVTIERLRPPRVRPLEVWDVRLADGRTAHERLGAHAAPGDDLAMQRAYAAHLAALVRALHAGAAGLEPGAFDEVIVAGGLATPTLAPHLGDAPVRITLATSPSTDRRRHVAALAAARSGHAVLDVGQTAVKTPDATWDRDLQRFPFVRAGMAPPADASPRGRAAIRAIASFAAAHVPPPTDTLLLALPCALDESLVPGDCTYAGWPGDTQLVRAFADALVRAPEWIARRGALHVRVCNDAELFAGALAVPPGRAVLALTLGFAPGAALVSRVDENEPHSYHPPRP